jgi:hypothetical protein
MYTALHYVFDERRKTKDEDTSLHESFVIRHPSFVIHICSAKRCHISKKLATADDMLTGHGLQKRANGQAQEARLFGISLASRTLSNVERYLRRCPGDLRLEVILLTAWQLLGNLVDQVNVVQSQLPYLELLELERHSSLVLRPYPLAIRLSVNDSRPPSMLARG